MPNLPLTGVPDQLQPQAPASAPAAPPPPSPAAGNPVQINIPQYDQQAAQAAAIQRDQSLQEAAQQLYPQDNTSSLLATLAGVAGNIAGALSKHGDVGNTALQYGDQLREQALNQQKQFVARTRDEEAKYKQEQQQKIELQNKQLRANSLVPLFNKVGDSATKAALFTQLAAGDVDGAEKNYRQFQEMERQKEQDTFNRKLKLDQADLAVQRFGLAQQAAELNDKLKQMHIDDFALKPAREQQRIVNQETREYNKDTANLKGPISDYVDIVQRLGGLDSKDAQDKLTRIMGLGGTVRGQITGSPDDKSLYQSLQRLFGGTLRREDFGSRFSTAEQKIISQAAGFTVGGGLFANSARNPDGVIQGLKVIENELRTKLDAAAANKQDKTLEGFEKSGAPLTPRAFATAIANASLTGPQDLNTTPTGVDPSIWVQMNRETRQQYFKHLKGIQ